MPQSLISYHCDTCNYSFKSLTWLVRCLRCGSDKFRSLSPPLSPPPIATPVAPTVYKVDLTKWVLRKDQTQLHCSRTIEMPFVPMVGLNFYGLTAKPLIRLEVRTIMWSPGQGIGVLLWHSEPDDGFGQVPADWGPEWAIAFRDYTEKSGILQRIREGK